MLKVRDPTFTEYLNGVAWTEAGKEVTRKDGWSIERIKFAEQVWNDCRQKMKPHLRDNK
jgi:hypothetical protein